MLHMPMLTMIAHLRGAPARLPVHTHLCLNAVLTCLFHFTQSGLDCL